MSANSMIKTGEQNQNADGLNFFLSISSMNNTSLYK